jgi:hypothetical protein
MEARCFSNCLSEQEREAIKTLLLARIAGGSTDPQTLLASAKCFLTCVPYGFYKAIQAYLLCQIVNGQVCPPCPPVPPTVDFNYSDQNMVLLFSNMEDVVLGNAVGTLGLTLLNVTSITGELTVVNSPDLSIVAATSLVSVGAASGVAIFNNTILTQVFLQSLITSAGDLNINGNPALNQVDLSAYVPRNGQNINLDSNDLDQTSVDRILASGVANPAFISGSIGLAGGTNSAPSAAGMVDKGILIARGVTVNTN